MRQESHALIAACRQRQGAVIIVSNRSWARGSFRTTVWEVSFETSSAGPTRPWPRRPTPST